MNEVENGVASVVAEGKAQTWISKSENKEKLDEEDENASRFKLRNGKEVSLFLEFHYFLFSRASRLKYCIVFAISLCFV